MVIVPIARLDEPAREAIAFANSISPDATAVHVTNDADGADELRRAWPEWSGGAELVIIESPYRALIGPLLAYLDVLQRHDPDRARCSSCSPSSCPATGGRTCCTTRPRCG